MNFAIVGAVSGNGCRGTRSVDLTSFAVVIVWASSAPVAPDGVPMRMFAIALVLSVSTAALAGDDVGPTMAALKDEKAQCRYLLQLCGEFAITDRIATENLAAAKAAVSQAASKSEARSALARADAGIAAKREALDKVTTGRTVMKAMHDKMPACVNECVDDKGRKVLAAW